MPQPLATSATTHPGLLHHKNEDSHAVFDTEEGGVVLLVCDGMGGMGRGDEASRIAVEVIRKDLEGGHGFPPDRLRLALRHADDEIRQALCTSGEGHPGSTAVAVYVLDGAAHVSWVGDSRAYHVRRGAIVERTRDHKLVEELVDAGQLTPQQARSSSLAHVVTRALGGRSTKEATVKPGSPGHVWKLFRGDRLVVMSDGVCDLVEDDEIAKVLTEGGSVDAIRDRLVELSLERGGHDNITCIVAEWTGPDWVEEEVATPVMRPGRELSDLLQDEATLHPDALPDDRPPPLDPRSDEITRVTEEIAHHPDARPEERMPVAPLPAAGQGPTPGAGQGEQVTPPTIDPRSSTVATPEPAAPEPAAPEPAAPAPPPAADAAAPAPSPEPPRHPPDPGGITFDWRFLVAFLGLVALILSFVGWYTRR
jgi:serine/threonine protein phosphatase PrpC